MQKEWEEMSRIEEGNACFAVPEAGRRPLQYYQQAYVKEEFRERLSRERRLRELQMSVFVEQSRELANRARRESSDLEMFWQETETEVDRYKRENESLRSQLSAKQDEIGQLSEELHCSETAREAAQASATGCRAGKQTGAASVCNLLPCLLPDLEFFPGSLKVIECLVPEPAAVLNALYAIHSGNSEQLSKKPISGMDGVWMECHFNTGKSDMGRIYYHKENGLDKTCVAVLIKKDKSHQNRDLAAIANWMKRIRGNGASNISKLASTKKKTRGNHSVAPRSTAA